MKELFTYLNNKEKIKIPLNVKLILGYDLTKDDLIFHGYLDLAQSDITELPDNLIIFGGLDLYGCEYLKDLPHGLKIYKDDEAINKMDYPHDDEFFKINGNLYIDYTGITLLPEDLHVSGSIFGTWSREKFKEWNPKFINKYC